MVPSFLKTCFINGPNTQSITLKEGQYVFFSKVILPSYFQHLLPFVDDDIDETLGVNVQFEESDDDGGDEEDVGEIKEEESEEEEGMEDAHASSTLKTSVRS